jgi:hypothetical protein
MHSKIFTLHLAADLLIPLFICLGQSAALAQQAAPANADEPSVAEKRLFDEDHLKGLPLKATLNYSFAKRGSLEAIVDDKSTIVVKKIGSSGRELDVQCLTGARKLDLPIEGELKGNPLILCFLERDIHEMKRLTGGSLNYYRKRIRMAIAETAKLSQINITVEGKSVPATEIFLDPFKDDPARARYTKFANKTYKFVLSDAVPGGVYEIRSVMHEEGKPGSVMLEESMRYQK